MGVGGPVATATRVGPRGGRREKHPRRRIVDAIFYVMRTGCPWRQLPKDFPPWPTVYWYFTWSHDDGTVEHVHDVLRGRVREADGRKAEPSTGLIDSQSVRTADTVPAATRGFDAGKKVKGRESSLITDTLGLLVAIHVVAASVQDRDGVKRTLLWTRLDHPQIRKIWVDQGFAGRLVDWNAQMLGRELDIVRKYPGQRGFQVQPKRWAIEHLLVAYCSPPPRQGLRDQPGPFRDHDPLGNDQPHGPPPHPRPTGDTAGPAPAWAKGFIDTRSARPWVTFRVSALLNQEPLNLLLQVKWQVDQLRDDHAKLSAESGRLGPDRWVPGEDRGQQIAFVHVTLRHRVVPQHLEGQRQEVGQSYVLPDQQTHVLDGQLANRPTPQGLRSSDKTRGIGRRGRPAVAFKLLKGAVTVRESRHRPIVLRRDLKCGLRGPVAGPATTGEAAGPTAIKMSHKKLPPTSLSGDVMHHASTAHR